VPPSVPNKFDIEGKSMGEVAGEMKRGLYGVVIMFGRKSE
jgi:hypothetical protein